MSKKTAVQILTDARAILKENWMQGEWFQCQTAYNYDTGRYEKVGDVCKMCAIGAVIFATTGKDDSSSSNLVPKKVARLLFNALPEKAQTIYADEADYGKHNLHVDKVINFNDDKKTTLKKVLNLFDRAIAAAS
jgi:hypothetical protein